MHKKWLGTYFGTGCLNTLNRSAISSAKLVFFLKEKKAATEAEFKCDLLASFSSVPFYISAGNRQFVNQRRAKVLRLTECVNTSNSLSKGGIRHSFDASCEMDWDDIRQVMENRWRLKNAREEEKERRTKQNESCLNGGISRPVFLSPRCDYALLIPYRW